MRHLKALIIGVRLLFKAAGNDPEALARYEVLDARATANKTSLHAEILKDLP